MHVEGTWIVWLENAKCSMLMKPENYNLKDQELGKEDGMVQWKRQSCSGFDVHQLMDV